MGTSLSQIEAVRRRQKAAPKKAELRRRRRRRLKNRLWTHEQPHASNIHSIHEIAQISAKCKRASYTVHKTNTHTNTYYYIAFSARKPLKTDDVYDRERKEEREEKKEPFTLVSTCATAATTKPYATQ